MDTRLTHLLEIFVLHPAADILAFVLRDDSPNDPAKENWWLSHAEGTVMRAEESLAQFTGASDQFHGPADVQSAK